MRSAGLARKRHPNKEVEAAVAEAEARGWRVVMQGHWGRLYCPFADRDGCQVGVWGTPKNAGNHAKQIRRRLDKCKHGATADEEAEDGKDDF